MSSPSEIPPCFCSVCRQIFPDGWVGSTTCCGAIAYGIPEDEVAEFKGSHFYTTPIPGDELYIVAD